MTSYCFDQKLLPYQSKYIQVSGHSMHFLDEGVGPVVLLLHGNPTWCFYYRNLIECLRKHFRVIAPDHIGCGLSDHPEDKFFRAEDRVDHLTNLLSQLGIERYSLVMHDWGGPIGTGLAVRNPDAVQKLLYFNTTINETRALPSIIKASSRGFLGAFITKYTRLFLYLTTHCGASKRLSQEVLEGYYAPYQTARARSAIRNFVADIPFSESHPTYGPMLEIASKLSSLSHIPVKLIWGMKDPCFNEEILESVAKLFPKAEVLKIPTASHLVLEDEPELCAETALEFLQKSTTVKQNALYNAFEVISKSSSELCAAIVPKFSRDHVRYERLSYSKLSSRINSYQRGLTHLGMQSGDRVLMLVLPGPEFLALSYAVMGRGAVPVFVDPGMGKENLFKCIRDADPQGLIGTSKAQLLRLKKKTLFPNLRFHVTASPWMYTGGANLLSLRKFASDPLPGAKASDAALIAFTSGATGVPKGVVFTNSMIKAQLDIFTNVFQVESGKKDLPLLPIFSLFNLAVGVASAFAPMDTAKPLSIEPDKISRIIQDLEVNYSFGSPTLWNKISTQCAYANISLPSLEKVFMAGAPVPEETLERVQRLLPNGVAFTPYGATEALPVTLVSIEEVLKTEKISAPSGELGTFVGKPVSGVSLKIIEPVDASIESLSSTKELPALQIGEIIVSGPNINRDYLHRPDATSIGKIPDGDSFWHRMGDMGYVDENGFLYFCGRKAHRVKTEDKTFYSVPTERFFNELSWVKRSALIALGDRPVPAIVVEPQEEAWIEIGSEKESFTEELRKKAAQLPITKPIEHFFFYKAFPVDARHNAKIFRDKLSDWANSL